MPCYNYSSACCVSSSSSIAEWWLLNVGCVTLMTGVTPKYNIPTSTFSLTAAAAPCSQAEIEHFVNPDDKRHPKFDKVAALQPLLYSRAMQMGELQGTRHCKLSNTSSAVVRV